MDEIAVIGGEGMNDEKAKMLKITTDQIEQKFGRGSIMKLGEGGEHLNIGVIPTGALPLDAALGIGGVPRGRIIEIYGPESSGKTTLALQILAEAQATADNVRGGARRFSAAKAVDGRADTYWATDDGVTAATLSLRFERPRRVNRILLQEYIPLGQRVGRFAVEWLDGDTWRPVETAEEMTTIGYKRIIRFAGVTTPALRVRFGQARGPLCISNVEAYDAPVLLEEPRIVRNGAGEVTLAAGDTQAEIRYTLDGTEPGPASELYTKPFPMTGRGVVKALVRDPEDGRTSAVASRGFDIPCGAFRVKELPDEEAVGLFDGDVSTVVYLPAGVAGFSADTGEERTFRGFAYTPDQSRWASGVVTRYRVSVDGRTAAEGEFSNIVNNPVEQVVEFEPQRGRTVRFEALSLAAGDRPGIAEFSVLTE